VDAERGYPDERWFGDERNYPDNEWRDRRGGYPADDEQGRGQAQRAGYSMADVNVGYGAEPRFAPPPPGYAEPGYGPGPGGPGGPGPVGPGGPGGPAVPGFDPRPTSGDPRSPGGPGPGYGPRPPDRGAPLLDPPTAEVPRTRAERNADDGVYRSKKPLHAAGIGSTLGVFELIMFVVFISGIFAGPIDVHRTIAGGLMLMALPLFGLGFYALLTGAAHTGPRAFLRTPLAYLPIGLLLMIAAGAAA
jgi:hypothetical protein